MSDSHGIDLILLACPVEISAWFVGLS